MDKHDAQLRRRNFLKLTTVGVGGAGLALATVPFIRSMSPSEAARAAGAPVEVNVSSLDPGVLITVEWRGRPVWILHRTEQMLSLLSRHDALLADPDSSEPQQPPYARNPTRSLKPAYFVAIGICTHLGCIPVYRPTTANGELGPNWDGGFYCPCHGSKFDLAGRVYKDVPAPTNLEIPPHTYLTETRLLVGDDSRAG